VVLVHRYFAPDTPPYAEILRALAASLADRGAQVTVLTCQPSYRRGAARAPGRETRDGVSGVRWPVLDDRRSTALKLVNMAWFCLRLVLARRAFRGADVVMAATTPPIAVALACSFMARSVGARFVYHKQDVWPEVGLETGTSFGPHTRLLRWLDHSTERRSARVVVLSRDMADTVARRDRAREPQVRTVVLNNFDPWDIDETPEVRGVDHPGLTLTFAGNLGRFQGIDRLIDVIRASGELPLAWHFFGDGPMAQPLTDLAGQGAAVTMHGYQSPTTVADFVRHHTDLGVVSLDPGVIRAAYPSKTLTYLRNGCPVLALVESDSELAEMVRDAGVGIAVGYDVPAVVEALTLWSGTTEVAVGVRSRARDLYDERFGMSAQLARWATLFEELVS
jgi:glycosyltransferase involved in cell wall biosynthesis